MQITSLHSGVYVYHFKYKHFKPVFELERDICNLQEDKPVVNQFKRFKTKQLLYYYENHDVYNLNNVADNNYEKSLLM